MFLHVIEANHIKDHKIWLRFNDGASGEIDLSGSLTGPVFEPLLDIQEFKAFRIEGNTISWANGADFAPEYLHDLLVAKRYEIVGPPIAHDATPY
ncbi:MAG: DUF2442 domain-containing protein [Candidatus Hydrogenedentes bacterium]|nr:DUF2442 domain-containing protein [Candidatus Hydrogenedentota bacterium]